jgi:hypothetical protein
MNLKLPSRKTWHAGAFVLFCALLARADRLTVKNATHYGKLVQINSSTLVFNEGCVAEQTTSISLADFVTVEFDDNCERPSRSMTSSPITLPCHGEEKELFTVIFRAGESTTAGAVETMNEGQIRIIPIQAKGYLLGPVQDVRSISYGSVCLNRLNPPQWPSSFRQLFKKRRTKPTPQ